MEETQIEHILVKSLGGNIVSEALCLRMTRENEKRILLFVQKKQNRKEMRSSKYSSAVPLVIRFIIYDDLAIQTP